MQKGCVVENFIQDEIFNDNLPQMRDDGQRAASVIKIPPTPSSNGAEVKVIRSTRRKKSISAYRQAGAIVISVPARLSKSEVRQVIPEMVSKVLSLEAREKIGEEDLYKRSLELLAKYLPECPVKPVSVTWRSMSERWGSCTTVERSIRISDRLNGAPGYVLD
ncbi:MAG: YgjP-like metallopeptidase domain-containing protein, partial [Actinomycetota bacterium]